MGEKRGKGEGDGALDFLFHILHHHGHGLEHVDVVLELGVDLGGRARVVLELLIAGQEHTGLGTAHELGIPCVD